MTQALANSDPLSHHIQSQPASATTVLIVDADSAMRLLLRVAMQREGLEIIEASSGQECLEIFQQQRPDLILMDAVMPEVDGFTCCTTLRKMAAGGDIPILMITSLDDPDSVNRAFEVGATDYLTKPIHWALLRHRVQRLQDMLKRQQAEYQIKVSLREKEALLKEIHHRVKNNLQIISSLLELQSYSIKDRKILDLFRESQNRVRLMALVHEKLYQSNNLGKVSFLEYVKTLSSYLLHSYQVNSNDIEVIINIDDISLDIDTAVPCGLIINELMSNALKYAFSQTKKGIINIETNRATKNQFSLIFQDNGVGISQDLDIYQTETLGLQLVASLADQLEGDLEVFT
ncbi:response regulator, partial [Leptolyngbya cf. ectocarpi LEGE 11479]